MKKYEKVNLNSDIYRERSHSKSPFSSKLMGSEHDSQTKKYQSVCCPNCRYLFKIQKQIQKPKSPTNIVSSRYMAMQNAFRQSTNTIQKVNSNKIEKRTVEVQTQQYLLGSLKSSPKRQIIRIDENKRHAITDRTPQRNSLMSFQYDDNDKMPAFTDRYPDQERVSDLKHRQVSISKQKKRISPKNTATKLFFPARSAYMKESVNVYKRQKVLNQTLEQRDITPSKHEYNQTNRQSQHKTMGKDMAITSNEIANELISKVQLSNQINEIIQYQMSLPPQISVPSYCKLLMYEMKDIKMLQQLKQKQKSPLLNVKQVDPEEDDLPRFNMTGDKLKPKRLFNNQ